MVTYILSFNFTLNAQGYVCAIGGGSEDYNDWSDAPYSWIVQKSDSGKIIIVDITDATSWLPTYFVSLGADTAYNKTISSISSANLQSTYDDLITAKAIFIRGGDQWDYVRLWKETKTDLAINYVFQHGGVIAGTSAGAAVLGDVDFSARYGTVYSEEALIDPFNHYMQFEENFLTLTPNVLFDSHFVERARHGRLAAMLYNRHVLANEDLIGVGIDDRTALCIYPDGTCEAMGSGAVSIFTIDDETRFEQLNTGGYTIEKLKCDQLTAGWKYDLINREICFYPTSANKIDTTRKWQLPLTDFRLTGSDNISEQLVNNFPEFISKANTGLFVVISHPGYSDQLTSLTDYLNQSLLNYQIVYLNKQNLNDLLTSQQINDAANFVLIGDSLSNLALLKDTVTLVGQSFQIKILTQRTPIFFFGKSGKIAGEFYTDNLYKDMYASYRGRMTSNSGIKIFGDIFFESSLYDNSDYYENRTASLLWGMMHNRKRLGVYLSGNAMVVVDADQKEIRSYGAIPPIFIDASQTTYVDSSKYRASGSVGTRQVVAMNNLRYGITTLDGYSYQIEKAGFENRTSLIEGNSLVPYKLILYQNYPNPFNPSTEISWQLAVGSNVQLKIYDAIGSEVETLVDNYQEAGQHSILYKTNSKLSSSVFFYRITTANHSETKSMVFIK